MKQVPLQGDPSQALHYCPKINASGMARRRRGGTVSDIGCLTCCDGEAAKGNTV